MNTVELKNLCRKAMRGLVLAAALPGNRRTMEAAATQSQLLITQSGLDEATVVEGMRKTIERNIRAQTIKPPEIGNLLKFAGISQRDFMILQTIATAENTSGVRCFIDVPQMRVEAQIETAFKLAKGLVNMYLRREWKAKQVAEASRGIIGWRASGTNDEDIILKMVEGIELSMPFCDFMDTMIIFVDTFRTSGVSNNREIYEIFSILLAHVLFDLATVS
jgi:hypothetical protein